MRLSVALALTLVITPALAQMPPRKAGLWEEVVTRQTRDGRDQASQITPFRLSQYCIDAAAAEQMSAMGSRLNPAMCSKSGVQQLGSTIVIDSACKVGEATMKHQRVVTSSSDTAYTMIVSSKREGPSAVPGTSVEMQMTIEAKWTGDCKDDQRPGDMVMTNGTKYNIRDVPLPAAR